MTQPGTAANRSIVWGAAVKTNVTQQPFLAASRSQAGESPQLSCWQGLHAFTAATSPGVTPTHYANLADIGIE
jgi:hypothetical protein